jgi:RecB family endonuclease NucS
MELYLAAAGRLIDEEELMLHASEEEMRRAVGLKPSLVEPGLKLHDEERRLQLASGEGSADLVGEDVEGNLAVLELKRRRVDEEAVVQLKRYVDSLKARTPRRVRGSWWLPPSLGGP